MENAAEIDTTDDFTPPDYALQTETPDGWTITHWLHANALSVSFTIAEPDDEDDDWSYEGWIKSDGCINWSTGPSGYAHACDPGDIDKLKRAFEELTRIGRQRMIAWRGPNAESPPA